MSEVQLDERPRRNIRVALSALVLGVVALVLSVIPGAAFVAFLPALLGLLMGIHGVKDKLADRWQSVTGLVLAPVAIILGLATIFGVIRL